MSSQRALVLVGGRVKQLPSGDTLAGAGSSAKTVRTVSGTSDTLLLADANNLILYTSVTTVTVVIPLTTGGGAVAWVSGTEIKPFQGAAGKVIYSLNGVASYRSAGVGSRVILTCLDSTTDLWAINGDIEANV